MINIFPLGVKRFSFHRLWFRLLSLRTKILFSCTNDMFSICSETRIPNVRVCVCVFAVQQSPTVCLPWCPAATISSRQNCLTQTSSCGHGRYFCEQLWMYAGLLETLFYRRCETRQTSEGRHNLLILFWSLSNWHRDHAKSIYSANDLCTAMPQFKTIVSTIHLDAPLGWRMDIKTPKKCLQHVSFCNSN